MAGVIGELPANHIAYKKPAYASEQSPIETEVLLIMVGKNPD